MYCAIYGNTAIAEMLLRRDDVGVNAADDEVVGLLSQLESDLSNTLLC